MKLDLHNLSITEECLKKMSATKGSKLFEDNILSILWGAILLWLIVVFGTILSEDLPLFMLSMCLFIVFMSLFIVRFIIVRKNQIQPAEASAKLVKEVQNFNYLIRVIDVNDQLVEAGN